MKYVLNLSSTGRLNLYQFRIGKDSVFKKGSEVVIMDNIKSFLEGE